MPLFKVTLVDHEGVAHLETSPVEAATAMEAAFLVAQGHGYPGLGDQQTSGVRICSWMARPRQGDADRAALVVVVPADDAGN